VVYLRQEGRGIGLLNKLKAYGLQDQGLDTVEANERLGFAADLRNYGVGAQILSDLGVRRLRLITNNPRKIAGLGGYGLEVVDRVPLVMDPGEHNAAYLNTKATRLGHLLQGPAAVIAWDGAGAPAAAALHELQRGLEEAAAGLGLALEPERHGRVLAVLGGPALAMVASADDKVALERGSLALLAGLAARPDTRRLQLLLAPDRQRSDHPPAELPVWQGRLASLANGTDPGPGGSVLRCWIRSPQS